MATGQLSIRITVDGSDYYVSNEEFMSSEAILHYPYVISAPVVTLGTNRGGWLQYSGGGFTLESRPIDGTHPFGGPRYTGDLLNVGATYPVAINFGVLGYDWLTGVGVLESITQDQLRFSLYPDEYSFSPVSTVTDVDGNTVVNPWAYGAVTHATPLIRRTSSSTTDTWWNPTGLTSGLTLYEDGTALSISATSTVITATDYSVDEGEVSLSSSSSKTLEDFFDYVATSLSLPITAADTTKASSASSYGVKLYWTKQDPLIEIASQVAEAFNHIFYIAPDTDRTDNARTLFLVDRANTPSSYITLEEDLILEASYTLGFPLGGVSGSFTVNTPEAGKLVAKEVQFRAENKPVGREENAPVFADSYGDAAQVVGRLEAIRDIDKKPVVSVTVPEIQVGYRPGDRFKFSREQDFLSADMIARKITFNFKDETTTLEGDATLTAYVRRF